MYSHFCACLFQILATPHPSPIHPVHDTKFCENHFPIHAINSYKIEH